MKPAEGATDATSRARGGDPLDGVLAVAAWTAAAAFALVTILSWLLAPRVASQLIRTARSTLYERMSNEAGWGWVGAELASWGAAVATPSGFIVAYSVPLLVVTAAALWLLREASLHRERLTVAHVDQAWRWAGRFALLLIPAAPVVVDDFWLSITWGRTLAAGINPYYEVPAWAADTFPTGGTTMNMTYGPLWGYVCAVVMRTANDSVLWGAALLKIVLAALWLGLLAVTRTLVRHRDPFAQLFSCVLVGWLPLGVLHTVGDGHNDVGMMALAGLWATLMARRAPLAASAALACSVLVKYVTAPLFLLHAIFALRSDHQRRWRELAAAAAVAAIVVGIVMGPLFRGLDFFAATRAADAGHFFRPADALYGVEELTGWSLWLVRQGVRAAFPALALSYAVALWRRPDLERLAEASAAAMCAVAMSIVSHLWPWYALWLIAPAALVPGTWMARWAFGIALVMPFPMLVWVAVPDSTNLYRFSVPAVVAYACTCAIALAVSTRLGYERRPAVPRAPD